MSKRSRPERPSYPPVWIPSILFPGIALIEVLRTFSAPSHFTDRALYVHSETWVAFGNTSILIGLLAFVVTRLRSWLCSNLESVLREDVVSRMPVAIASLGMFSLIFLLKYCQYRGFQLGIDTANSVQVAFNSFHRPWLESTIFGCNALAIHFALTTTIAAPLLLVSRSAVPLIALQCLAISSMGWATFELGLTLTSSALAGFLAMFICYTHPLFAQLIAAELDSSAFIAPFFLWSMVSLLRLNWRLSLLCAVLMLTGREQVPFTLVGLGLFLVLDRSLHLQRSRVLGSALILIAPVIWLGEMAVIHSFPNALGENYWLMYSAYGDSKAQILRFILTHPMTVAINTLLPFSKLRPLAGGVLFCALLPLLRPISLLPLAAAALPQLLIAIKHGYVLSNHIITFRNFHLHYSSLILGPLFFAVAIGIARAYAYFRNSTTKEYLLPLVLIVGGFGIRSSTAVLRADWHLDWFYSAPPVISMIPPNASLWTEDFFSAWVASRAQVKVLPRNEYTDWFSRLLFRPQYVLISKSWLQDARWEIRGPVLRFLASNHYIKLADTTRRTAPAMAGAAVSPDSGIILLKDPLLANSESRSEPIILAAPQNAAELQGYYRYLASSDL